MLAIPNEERDVPKGTQLQAMLAIPNEERDVPKGTQLQAMLAIPNEERDVPKGTQLQDCMAILQPVGRLRRSMGGAESVKNDQAERGGAGVIPMVW